MKNEFFLGINSYNSEDYEFLPGRTDDVRQLSYLLDNETVSILCSEPRIGKTSLINAGILVAEKLSQKKVCALKFDIPQFKFGDEVLEKQLIKFINSKCDKPSYIDMVFENDNSLWYASKRLQACYKDCKRFYLILDSFENFFTYGTAARKEVAKALANLIYGEIPSKFSEEMQKIMLGQSDVVISKDGMNLLYEPLKISVLFSVSKDQYNSMSELNDSIRGIFQNTMELLPFDFDTAKTACETIVNQPFEDLPVVEFDAHAVDKIVSGVAYNGVINPGFLRNAVLYFRNLAKQCSQNLVNKEFIESSEYFSKSRLSNFENLIEDENSRVAFSQFLVNEMVVDGETQPLQAYKGIAQKKYGLSDEILDLAKHNSILKSLISADARTFYLPYNSEIFKYILKDKKTSLPIVEQKTVSKQKDTIIHGLTTTVQSVSPVKVRRKPWILAIMGIAIVSMSCILLAFSLKGDAERSAQNARSSMLTAFAFQKLETDPTFSLRLAQRAISLDTTNIQAYSALLNSFYNTDIFYNISGEYGLNVVKAEISDDCKYIATYVKNDLLEQYSARILNADGDVIVEIPHKKEVTSISISRDNSKIITTSYDSTARVFDFKGNELLTIKNHKAILWTADFSFDNSKILTGGSDYKVKIWDSEGNELSTLSGHDFDVYSARFSPDASMIITSGGDNTARLWKSDGKLQKVFAIKEDNRFSMSIIISAEFSPDGKFVLLAANDYLYKNHKARLFDLDGNELISFSGHNDWINSASFSSDGKHIITASRDKFVRVFALNGELEKVLKGHNSNVWNARFMTDNQSIITVGDDHTIRSWTIGKRFETYPGARNVSFACFSKNGLNIVVVQDTVAQSWDLTGEIVSTFVGHHSAINTARYSPDGKSVVTASKDGSVRVWDAVSGTLQNIYCTHNSSANDVEFSPDGKYLVSVSNDSAVVIRNLVTGTELKVLDNSAVSSVSFSPSGEIFATGNSDGQVVLWDLKGNILKTFHGHDGRVNSVCFSPDGQYIISTSSDETAVLWDRLGQMQFTFRGYENKVNSAVFSPDGKYILTTSDDGSARLWTTDGKDVMNFKHDGKVSSAVFSPDGKYILTVYTDSHKLKTLKLRIISPDGITRHIDQLDLYGSVWKPDAETITKYGMTY